MKRILIFTALLFPFLVCGQTGTQIFSISNVNITVDNLFIDLPTNYWGTAGHSLGNPIPVSIGNQSYTIKTGRFTGWDNEPGDYDVIEISKNGQQLVLFKDGEGIVKYNNSMYMPPNYAFANRFVSYAENDYFISVPLSATSKALIFMGKPYGTDLPRLIIFVLTETDAKLVFCKRMYVESITKTVNDFSMVVQSNLTSVGDGVPELHTIWLQNQDLWFKNN